MATRWREANNLTHNPEPAKYFLHKNPTQLQLNNLGK